ncbi:MAG: hypothetical protein P8175_11555 [Deltaproteobacteria bacterium]
MPRNGDVIDLNGRVPGDKRQEVFSAPVCDGCVFQCLGKSKRGQPSEGDLVSLILRTPSPEQSPLNSFIPSPEAYAVLDRSVFAFQNPDHVQTALSSLQVPWS